MPETKWLPSACCMCQVRCQIRTRVEDGVITRIEGNGPFPGALCPRGNAGLMLTYDRNRIFTPLKRTNPEKGLGVDPKFVEISWEEALSLIAERLAPVMRENPYNLRIGAHDAPRVRPITAFAHAFGTPHVGSAGGTAAGISCGLGLHMLGSVIHGSFLERADLEHCNHLMLWGVNLGFEAYHDLTVDASRMADARLRGMKLTVVDPRFSTAASKADEWVPIRPGTDAALALGMVHVLINELGIYDARFLKAQTNAPYLIGPDGYFARDPASGKPLVWDPSDGRARTYDDETLGDFALTGEYHVNGQWCRPAFQLLKEHTRKYTPEKVAEITTVPAETVRRLAQDWGQAARIGSTIVLEGKEFPWRPVSIVFYRGVLGQRHSAMNTFALELLAMVVGALDVPGSTVRAPPGATMPGGGPPIPPGPDGIIEPDVYHERAPVAFAFPPRHTDLQEWFPVSEHQTHVHHVTALEPERYGLKPGMINLQHFSNPFSTLADPQTLARSFQQTYNIVCDVVLTETAQFADIFLPEATYLERWHFLRPHREWTGWVLVQPAISPIRGVPDFVDVLTDLAERLGILHGPGGMNEWLNLLMGLQTPYQLDLGRKYSYRDVIAQCALSYSKGQHDLAWFQEHGALQEPIGASKYQPYGKMRLPLYIEFLKVQGDALRQSFADNSIENRTGVKWDFSDYAPLPSWQPGLAHKAPPEFDMFAINYKTILCTHGRGANNPWLMELMERDPYALKLVLNAETARRRGIREGDALWVESPVGRVTGKVSLTQGMHPECVGIAGSLGHWAPHSIAQGKGAHFNSLCSFGLEATDAVSGGLEHAIAKVKIYKA